MFCAGTSYRRRNLWTLYTPQVGRAHGECTQPAAPPSPLRRSRTTTPSARPSPVRRPSVPVVPVDRHGGVEPRRSCRVRSASATWNPPILPCRSGDPTSSPPSSPPSPVRRPSVPVVPVDRHVAVSSRGDLAESLAPRRAHMEPADPPLPLRRSHVLAAAVVAPPPSPSSVLLLVIVHGTAIPRRGDLVLVIASKHVTRPSPHRLSSASPAPVPPPSPRRTAVKNAYFLCQKRVLFNYIYRRANTRHLLISRH